MLIFFFIGKQFFLTIFKQGFDEGMKRYINLRLIIRWTTIIRNSIFFFFFFFRSQWGVRPWASTKFELTCPDVMPRCPTVLCICCKPSFQSVSFSGVVRIYLPVLALFRSSAQEFSIFFSVIWTSVKLAKFEKEAKMISGK